MPCDFLRTVTLVLQHRLPVNDGSLVWNWAVYSSRLDIFRIFVRHQSPHVLWRARGTSITCVTLVRAPERNEFVLFFSYFRGHTALDEEPPKTRIWPPPYLPTVQLTAS